MKALALLKTKVLFATLIYIYCISYTNSVIDILLIFFDNFQQMSKKVLLYFIRCDIILENGILFVLKSNIIAVM